MLDYLDTNVVIYLVERDPTWGPKAQQRIAVLRSAGDQIAISDIHRLECLVGPLASGDAVSLKSYNTFFADPDISVLPINGAVWERAARIRATYAFKPLDSLHLAAAVEHGCRVFLTNDASLARFPDIAMDILS